MDSDGHGSTCLFNGIRASLRYSWTWCRAIHMLSCRAECCGVQCSCDTIYDPVPSRVPNSENCGMNQVEHLTLTVVFLDALWEKGYFHLPREKQESYSNNTLLHVAWFSFFLQIVWGLNETEIPAVPPGSSCRILSLRQVEMFGQEHTLSHIPPHPHDMATICYTSGTTGVPKGMKRLICPIIFSWSAFVAILKHIQIYELDCWSLLIYQVFYCWNWLENQ